MTRSASSPRLNAVLGGLAVILGFAGGASAGGELLPLRPGMTVVTRAPEYGGVDPRQPETVVIFDTRDPECTPGAETGFNWAATADWNAMPNATMRAEDEWSVRNLGPAFGVALDDATPPNIYVTTGPIYSTPDLADGRVSRLDGSTGAITRLADLPNAPGADVGLGNICYDATHRQLHVTNFEDGKLYRLGMDGTVLSSFDPFGADDGLPGFAPIEERIWGVGVLGDRVYFGTWRKDSSRTAGLDNAVFSVAMAPTGDYLPATLLEEFVVAPIPGKESAPIADIAFSADGLLMLIGERTMFSDSGSGAHGSRVLSYEPVGGAWVRRPNEYSIGFNDGRSFFGWNASGGVDLDQCVDDAGCPAEAPKSYATGDALIFNPLFAYGLQVLPYQGGRVEESYVIDLDNDLVSQDKTALGDVEVMRHFDPPVVVDPPVFDVAWVDDPSDCNLGLLLSWEAAAFEPPGSGTYSVYRSETSCADALAQAPVASGLTDLSWFDGETDSGIPYYYVIVAATAPVAGSLCSAASPSLTTEICLDPPIEDSGLAPWPDVVWAVLRARHDRQEVTFSWDAVRPLLPDEHFHLLKTSLDASTAFSHVNGEGQRGHEWTEVDESAWLQFFDLRVANRCEDLSIDEFPPSY